MRVPSRPLLSLALLALGACGAPRPAAPPATARPARPPAWATEAERWGKYHSRRFQLTIPLPDGKAWKIDDHRGPALVATHAATGSTLTVQTLDEPGLVNRQRCEERARALGWLPKPDLTTVADHVRTGPDAYDSRVWVALDPDHADTRVDGHVFLFGGFLRRCLLVHLSTTVPTVQDEAVLATRLAIGSERIVEAIAPDPLRTTDDATVPRDKPGIER